MLGKTTEGHVQAWVNKHILDVTPSPTWDEASEIFRKEFSSYDHASHCLLKLVQMKQIDPQNPKRTASDFLREVEILAVAAKPDLDSPLLITLLISVALAPSVSQVIRNRLGTKITQINFSELKSEVIFTGTTPAPTVDIPARPAGPNSKCNYCSKPGHSYNNCKLRLGKHCTHCDWVGHLVSECKKFKRDNSSGSATNLSSTPRNTTTKPGTTLTTSPPVCFKCNQTGHKADNPSCPKYVPRFNNNAIANKVRAIRESKAEKREGQPAELSFTEDQIAEALYDYETKLAGSIK